MNAIKDNLLPINLIHSTWALTQRLWSRTVFVELKKFPQKYAFDPISNISLIKESVNWHEYRLICDLPRKTNGQFYCVPALAAFRQLESSEYDASWSIEISPYQQRVAVSIICITGCQRRQTIARRCCAIPPTDGTQSVFGNVCEVICNTQEWKPLKFQV